MRRAELSMNVIVMAVIALLILVVLAYITLKNTGNFSQSLNDCGTGNECVLSADMCENKQDGTGGSYIAIRKSCNEGGSKGNFCCQKIGSFG